jgi:hypothetical protein
VLKFKEINCIKLAKIFLDKKCGVWYNGRFGAISLKERRNCPAKSVKAAAGVKDYRPPPFLLLRRFMFC